MRRGALRIADVVTPASAPRYELRARTRGPGDEELEVWQLPAPATPHVRTPIRVAGLGGRNLELVQHRVLKRLADGGVRLQPRLTGARGSGGRPLGGRPLGAPTAYAVTERLALTLGLLFRTLAPMRSRENMVRVAEGIEAMGQEEAAYWLGMAMHRTNPRRVLSALRMLLADPARRTARAR